jgi:hypothetical protein
VADAAMDAVIYREDLVGRSSTPVAELSNLAR